MEQAFWLTWYTIAACFMVGWYVMISDEVLRQLGRNMARVTTIDFDKLAHQQRQFELLENVDFAKLLELQRQLTIMFEAMSENLQDRPRRVPAGSLLSHLDEVK